MDFISKAALTLAQGANLRREDLSNTLSVTQGPKRPFTQNAPRVGASNTTHQWNEIGLNTAGRTNVAGGGATYAEGNLPPVNAKAPSRITNVTCRTGRTAQVTDDMMAAFNGGGKLELADGAEERMLNDALDLEASLVGIECLNQIEWMHITGDSSVNTMEGGETDGLIKWTTASGFVVATGGTTTTPVNFSENFIKDGARGAALLMPAIQADTLLVAPELVPDIQAFIASGAGAPVVYNASGDNSGFVAGREVSRYNTAYSVLDIRVEPYLSSAYNSQLSNPACIGYNKSMVKHAELIPFHAEGVARTDTSVKRMVTTSYAQEHRVPGHTFIISNVKSSVA